MRVFDKSFAKTDDFKCLLVLSSAIEGMIL